MNRKVDFSRSRSPNRINHQKLTRVNLKSSSKIKQIVNLSDLSSRGIDFQESDNEKKINKQKSIQNNKTQQQIKQNSQVSGKKQQQQIKIQKQQNKSEQIVSQKVQQNQQQQVDQYKYMTIQRDLKQNSIDFQTQKDVYDQVVRQNKELLKNGQDNFTMIDFVNIKLEIWKKQQYSNIKTENIDQLAEQKNFAVKRLEIKKKIQKMEKEIIFLNVNILNNQKQLQKYAQDMKKCIEKRIEFEAQLTKSQHYIEMKDSFSTEKQVLLLRGKQNNIDKQINDIQAKEIKYEEFIKDSMKSKLEKIKAMQDYFDNVLKKAEQYKVMDMFSKKK